MANDLYIYDESNDNYYKLAYTGPEVDEALGRILRQKELDYVVHGYVGFEMGWSVSIVGKVINQAMSEVYLSSSAASNQNGGASGENLAVINAVGVSEDEAEINKDLSNGDPDEPSNVVIPGWSPSDTGTGFITDIIEVPLDMPVKYPVVAGSVDRDDCIIVRTNSGSNTSNYWANQNVASNGTRLQFRVYSPIQPSGTYSFVARIMVSARRRKAPKVPPFRNVQTGNNGNNLDVLNSALSYLTARENGRKFAYGQNWTYSLSKKVNDDLGAGLMECDTLVTMCMLGIPYGSSQYSESKIASGRIQNGYGTHDLMYDKETGEYYDNDDGETRTLGGNSPVTVLLGNHRNSNYGWAVNNLVWAKKSRGVYENGLGKLITNTSAQNWWGWDNYSVFTDAQYARKGDIVVFRRPDSTQFDFVSHVGILDIVNDEKYVIHVSTESLTDGKIVAKAKLTPEGFYANGRYSEENTYFIRPNCPQSVGYNTGYKVLLNGVVYSSTVDNNTSRPDPEDLENTHWEVVE